MSEQLAIQLPEMEGWAVVSAATMDECRDLSPETFGSESDKAGMLAYVSEGSSVFLMPPLDDPGCGVVRFEISEIPGLAFEDGDSLESTQQAVIESFSRIYGGLDADIRDCAFREIEGRRCLYFIECLLESSNRVVYCLPRPDRLSTLSITLVAPAGLVDAYSELAELVVRGTDIFEDPGSEEAPNEPRRQTASRIVHEVGSLEEAVELARSWKKSGACDWFRGQTAPWPMVPTALRLSREEFEDRIERIRHFEAWVRQTEGLEALAENKHAFWAVAQHYGEPTFYLDFTDDPVIAGFFAANGSLEPGQTCCLLGFGTEHFQRSIADLWNTNSALEEASRPELVSLEVADLWRLEAQRGQFLLTPRDDLELLYPYFRWIEFPFSEPSQIDRQRIYPTNKSALEIRLDSFWESDRRRVDVPEAISWAKNLGAAVFEEEDDGRANVGHHPGGDEDWPLSESWNDNAVRPWKVVEPERWMEVSGPADVHLSIDLDLDLPNLEKELRTQARELLTRQPELRRRLVQWGLRTGAGPAANPGVVEETKRPFWRRILGTRAKPEALPDLESARDGAGLAPSHALEIVGWLDSMWDGIRRLPYTDDQCAKAIARCICLGLQFKDGMTAFVGEEKHQVGQVLPDPISVEVTGRDGGSARAWVTTAGLEAAFLPDLEPPAEMRDSPFWTKRSKGEQILFAQTDPQRLFDLESLAELMICEYIPSQAVTRNVRPHFYSPARLLRFGLP